MADHLTDILHDYAAAHTSSEPEWLRCIDRDTNLRLLNPRMCSGHLQGRLLKLLTQLTAPQKVLELGTYSGYSALCLAEGLALPHAYVDTVEVDDELEDFIREHMALAPCDISSRLHLHFGDALDIVPKLEPGWQLVFIDADKRRYNDYLDMLLPLVSTGALIIADNTLWGGNVVDTAHERDAQTRGVRAFNERVATDPELDAVLLPLRDGLTLMRRR